jgi:tetratricopeptide (TPR) repeat protein
MGKTHFRNTQYKEALIEIKSGLSIKGINPDSLTHLKLKIWMVGCHLSLANPEEAMKILEAILPKLQCFEDPEYQYNLAIALTFKGQIFNEASQPHKALKLHKQAFLIRKKINNPVDIARSLVNMALAHSTLGNYTETLELLKKSIAYCEKANNYQQLITSLFFYALRLREIGELNEAQDAASRAYKLAESHSFSSILPMMILGPINNDLGDFKKGLEYTKIAMDHHKKTGFRVGFLSMTLAYVQMLGQNRQLSRNDPYIIHALAGKIESQMFETIKQLIRGLLLMYERNYGSAEKMFKSVLDQSSYSTGQSLIYESLTEIAFRNFRLDPYDELRLILDDRLLKWEEYTIKNNLSPTLCKIRILQSKLDMISIDFESAINKLEEALQISTIKGLYRYEILVRKELSKVKDQKKTIESISGPKKVNFNATMEEMSSYITDMSKLIKDENI